MNWRRHFYDFPRSPDEGGAPDPVVEAVVEPVVEPVAEPELQPDPEPDPAPQAIPTPAPTAPRWALERIGEETNKRQAAEERARSYEEIVKRMQSQPKAPAADPAAPAPQERLAAPVGDQSAVQQEAARIVFERDLVNVSNAGVTAYGGQAWGDAINLLNKCNANTAEFVASVMEIDPSRTHEIMFEIAKDPEKAVALARMTPVRRATEITRMSMPKTDPKPAIDPKQEVEPKPAVSRAPAPKPAIAPHASAPEVDPRTPEGNEKMTDAEFERWYKSTYMRKTG